MHSKNNKRSSLPSSSSLPLYRLISGSLFLFLFPVAFDSFFSFSVSCLLSFHLLISLFSSHPDHSLLPSNCCFLSSSCLLSSSCGRFFPFLMLYFLLISCLFIFSSFFFFLPLFCMFSFLSSCTLFISLKSRRKQRKDFTLFSPPQF